MPSRVTQDRVLVAAASVTSNKEQIMASDTTSARLYVAEVTKFATVGNWANPRPGGRVVLRAALKNPANAVWASATPSAEFSMTVIPEALAWFEARVGRDLHITFEDVPDEQQVGQAY